MTYLWTKLKINTIWQNELSHQKNHV
jgi:hypothetical protein